MVRPSPVLLLDDLFADPEFIERAIELRRHAPPAFVDQLDAAAAQVTRGRTAALRSGALSSVAPIPYRQVPDWLRLGLLDSLVAWLQGEGSTCLHDPTLDRPQPVIAAAWRPQLVVCGHCAGLLALPRQSSADRRCDACGYETTGPGRGDGITPGQIQCGPLLYLFGTCNDCRWWTS